MTEDKKTRTHKIHTLNMKLIFVVLIAFFASAAASYIFNAAGSAFIEKYLLSDEKIDEREKNLIQSFADFVEENEVASYETEKFDEWREKHNNVYITIFRENKFFLRDPENKPGKQDSANDDSSSSYSDTLPPATDIAPSEPLPGDGFLLETPSDTPESEMPEASDNESATNGSTTEKPAAPSTSKPQQGSSGGKGDNQNPLYSDYDFTVYPVQFNDCVCSVSITDDYEASYFNTLSIIEVIIFCVVFILIIIRYSKTLIKRIKDLSEQTSKVSDGKIETVVTATGRDELSDLSEDIETMRCSLVERINGEKEAWSANQELITSISHDIRNPLTTLIGYSDMLINGQYENDEQFNRYIGSCRDKAYQLKDLTDELFGYFLVFGKPEISLNLETENAQILVGQLMGEPLAELRSRGYTVNSTFFSEDSYISVDVMMLKRIFDNLFSNISKYADIKRPVTALTALEKECIYIKLINTVKREESPTESTKIGVKTCERLCDALEITLSYREEKSDYITEIRIPTVKIKGE